MVRRTRPRISSFRVRASRAPESRKCSNYLAVLNKAEIVSNLVVENTRLRVARLRQPIDAARIRRLGLVVNCLDQRPSQPPPPCGSCDKLSFQIAISVWSPGRAMKEVAGNSH